MNEFHIEDDQLIRQTLEGDHESFANLIRKHQGHLFDLAFRILGNRPDAEDVLQDSFIAAYRNLPRFNHKSRFSTWIYAIALNRIRNHLRRSKILRWSSLDAPPSFDDELEPMQIAELGDTPEVATEKKLEMEALQREVRDLPLKYQTLFIMHYFQDMPIEEIAERLDRPVGTVKVYLHRSRKLLYKRLAPKPQLMTRTRPSLSLTAP